MSRCWWAPLLKLSTLLALLTPFQQSPEKPPCPTCPPWQKPLQSGYCPVIAGGQTHPGQVPFQSTLAPRELWGQSYQPAHLQRLLLGPYWRANLVCQQVQSIYIRAFQPELWDANPAHQYTHSSYNPDTQEGACRPHRGHCGALGEIALLGSTGCFLCKATIFKTRRCS